MRDNGLDERQLRQQDIETRSPQSTETNQPQNAKPITKHRLVNAYRQWLPELNVRADLTLKRAIVTNRSETTRTFQRLRDDEDIIATIVRAMNRLNRYVLGGERRTRRLSAVATYERGKHSGHPHVHLLVERPASISVSEFSRHLKRAWLAQPFAHREMRVGPVTTLGGSLNYNTKHGFGRLVYFHKHNPTKGLEPDERDAN
jgi:hypothetical protein